VIGDGEDRSLPISGYAASRRAKPYTWANVAGRPWSVSVSGGAVEGRALRARRSCQLSRQCARCARVITCSVGKALGSLVGVIPIVTSMVSHRTTLSQLRRTCQRGQSPNRTAKHATGSGVFGGGSGRDGRAADTQR